MRAGTILFQIVVTVTLTVMVAAICCIGVFQAQASISESGFSDVRASVEEARGPQGGGAQGNEAQGSAAAKNPEELLAAYGELKKKNEDLVGWVRIEGTAVDYPVMQTKADPEYYLYRSFERTNDKHGTPFMDVRCDVEKPSDVLFIYGHHMKDGTMFASLMQYAKKEYCESYPVVHFDTLAGLGTYRVIAAFRTQASADAQSFSFFQMVDAATREGFDAYLANLKKQRLYDTGEWAEYGDKLIALTTCEYSQENGRMVVVAKRISP